MKIYVGNLPRDLTEERLEELARPFGTPRAVSIDRDHAGGASRGFGFVEYASAGEAREAITGLHGKEVDGQILDVREANEATPWPPDSFLHSRH